MALTLGGTLVGSRCITEPMRYTPSAHWWQYPLAKPSVRFSTVNTLVRQLAQRYDTLSGVLQASWTAAAAAYPWWWYCLPWLFDFPLDFSPTGSGVDAYQGVNAANWCNSLGVSDTPPIGVTLPDHDTLEILPASGFPVYWSGRSAPPGGVYYAHFRCCSLMHEPESGPAMQRYRWAGSLPISYETPLPFSAICSALAGFDSMPFTSVAVTVMDSGGAPWFGQRLNLPL